MEAVDFISAERLATYEKFVDDRKKAVALHNHTLQLGSSLMAMIALMELALRNSSNQRLIADFGRDQWLLPAQPTLPLLEREKKTISLAHKYAQRAAYAKLSYKQKAYLDAFAFPSGLPTGISHKHKTDKRQALFVVSHGQVISQTTFSFWKRLYSSEYQEELWKPSLKKVFPNKKLKRSDVSKALETIYSVRNRVAHHEPVYGKRLVEVMSALNFIRKALGNKDLEEDSSFKRFSKIHHLRLHMDYQSFLEAWRTLT